MPNWVTNVITAPSQVITALRTQAGPDQNGDCHDIVDFGNVVPVPACIEESSTPAHVRTLASIALGLYDFRRMANATDMLIGGKELMAAGLSDEDFELFVKYLRSYRECGYTDWYEWNCANWGTKWNAVRAVFVGPIIVRFETAWSPPHPVIEQLARMFPNHTIGHEWADEDTGNNVGWRTYGGGRCVEKELSGTAEGWRLALKLTGADEYYEERGGKWYYVDGGEPEEEPTFDAARAKPEPKPTVNDVATPTRR